MRCSEPLRRQRRERTSAVGPDASGGSWFPADANERISPTIVIRRPLGRADLAQRLLSGSLPPLSRAEAAQLIRVAPEDLAAVEAFARGHGLAIVTENAEARTLRVTGSVAQVGKAFGVEIEWRVDPQGQKYLSYRGELTIPAPLTGIVEAVLGLDQRPIARRAGQ